MKIAWFTPFCKSSAIGRYSAAILDELNKEHEVVVFATGLSRWEVSLRPHLPIVRISGKGGSAKLCQQLSAFDIAVYNLGDHSRFHSDIWRTQITHPGVSIVHDVSTWNLAAGTHLHSRKTSSDWLSEVEYSHGSSAHEWAEAFLSDRASRGEGQEESLRYHMARSCVRGAIGIVVHGEWARHHLAELVPTLVVHIDFPAFLGPTRTHTPDVKSDRVGFLTIGGVNPNKGIDLVIEAIAGSDRLRGEVQYTIAGGMTNRSYVEHLRRLIRQRSLEMTVRLIDRPDDRMLERLIGEADVLVNLRYPHLGECSGSLQEALFHGKPTVVWNHGYYAEFPDDVVCKVGSLDELAGTLERLAASPEERRERGERALVHARERFCTRRYCRELLAFLEACCHERPACRLADRLARRLGELGGTPSLAERLAHEIDLFSRLRMNPRNDKQAA